MSSLIIENIGTLCTMVPNDDDVLGRISGATLVIEEGRITLVDDGSAPAALDTKRRLPGVRTIDAANNAVLPGLVDVHTHVVFADDRADEFAMRARGATYAEIMAAGGGIRSTTTGVRTHSKAQLEDASRPRLSALLRNGVTTCEIKSGYGLTVDDECKMLRAATALGNESDLPDVVPTFLGAHAVPEEFDKKTDAYFDCVVEEMLPKVAEEKLAERCDIFIEGGAFDVGHGRRLLEKARALGLAPIAHVEQLSRSGGAALAAELGIQSVSHLEFASDADVAALGAAGITAEVLASAQVFLGMKQRIPGRALADAGCPIAIGTDLNPGSAHVFSLPLAAGLAVTNAGLTADEALLGMTLVAARSLARTDRGYIATGAIGDVVIVDDPNPYALVYQWGRPLIQTVVKQGIPIH